jgi:hypothetical protein
MLKTQRFPYRTVVQFGPLLLLLGMQTERRALAQDVSYSFTLLATLGQPAPGGGYHVNDFEPGALNNRGDVIYGTDVGTDPSTGFGEGVFLRRAGQTSELDLARTFANAPGGGVFDVLLLGQTVVNDPGDAVFAFTLQPFSFPVGVNSGVYRYSRVGGEIPVVVPFMTPTPDGESFQGASFNPNLNNRGDLLFTGIVKTDKGIHVSGEDYIGLGLGLFKADEKDQITSIVNPGDAAPGGGSFDMAGAVGSWINEAGDIAFAAHVAGEEVYCPSPPNPTPPTPQAQLINALTSVYFKDVHKGTITRIAHVGEVAPGGGIFRYAISPVLNDSGDIVFLGDISEYPFCNQHVGVYLHHRADCPHDRPLGHSTIAVARPGDAMPGGGAFVTASILAAENLHLNNAGEVVFNALLDTGDTGLYVWSHGLLRLVARAGTFIPGVGTVGQLLTFVTVFPPLPGTYPNSGAINNNRGQVFFSATLTDGRGVLLLATPKKCRKRSVE